MAKLIGKTILADNQFIHLDDGIHWTPRTNIKQCLSELTAYHTSCNGAKIYTWHDEEMIDVEPFEVKDHPAIPDAFEVMFRAPGQEYGIRGIHGPIQDCMLKPIKCQITWRC